MTVFNMGTFKQGFISSWLVVLLVSTNSVAFAEQSDGLGSWKDVSSKQAILRFIHQTTTPQSSHYVIPEKRIAVFDNDGTLWPEQPMYFQLLFVIDEIHALASDHPEWRHQEPFASILKGQLDSAFSGGERALLDLVKTVHAGMTTEAYERRVKQWIDTARHPQTGLRFTEMVYQPMLEVMTLLRKHHFDVYIVSGGGDAFMRVWSENVYGVPPQNVIGSRVKTRFEMIEGQAVIVRQPEIDFINDKQGKPIGIQQQIGQRPLAAFGNSDGDLQMLQWTTSGQGVRLGLIVHHTDDKREWAYDRQASFGKLDKGLRQAKQQGWILVDMKRDWKAIYSKRDGN